MPRVTQLQTNFTAGELSPRLYGRVDVARYQNGAKAVRDVVVKVHGGVARRPSSVFVAETKTSASRSRLIPFIKNADTSYALEFGNLYMRVFKDGAPVLVLGVPYEIVTPYTSAQVLEMDYTQGADTMFLFHEDVAPYKLVCSGDASWAISAAAFVETPFEEPGSYPAATLTPSASTPVGGACAFVASANVFAAGDVGSSVKINGGIVKITAYTDPMNVAGIIKQVLSSTTAAPQDAWSLHAPAWSASRGYPRTGTLYEQRLICAGSPTFPQTVWGSVTGAYLDFSQGTADDDAFAFTIASDIANPIRYVASNTVLLVFTAGAEFTITGGLEKPLAPTNAQIKPRANYGCAGVRPVRIRESELFVQRAGRKVRSFGYSVASDNWSGPDLSILAEHLTEGGIVDMCWQQEPDSIVWMARGDGALLSITLDKDQEVTAWCYHEGFSGIVESMVSTPASDGDQVLMVVRRTIGGATVRYVEYLSALALADCAVLASAAATDTWTGLDHLEGEEVSVVADSVYLGLYTVTGGQVVLRRTATTVEIGLPYTSRLELLDPEIQTGMGSASGNAMRTSEVTVRFYKTTGCKVNGKALAFRNLGAGLLDAAPEQFTGVKRIENLGWERGTSDLEFTQEDPMPFHILSVTRKFTVNDG